MTEGIRTQDGAAGTADGAVAGREDIAGALVRLIGQVEQRSAACPDVEAAQYYGWTVHMLQRAYAYWHLATRREGSLAREIARGG